MKTKVFKIGDRVQFRPWENCPKQDTVDGEVTEVLEHNFYNVLWDWKKRKGEKESQKHHANNLYNL